MFDWLLVSAIIVLALLLFRMATMSITTTWAITESGEGTGIGGSVNATHTAEEIFSYTMSVPVSTTDEENNVTFHMSRVQALIIATNTDVTIKVNSSGSPTDTLAIKAAVPFVWQKDSGIAAPIDGTTGAVTKFFITNASASVVATVKVRGCQSTS